MRQKIVDLDDGDTLYKMGPKDSKACQSRKECKNLSCFVVSFKMEGEPHFFTTCLSCELEFWKQLPATVEQVRLAFKKILEENPEFGLEI